MALFALPIFFQSCNSTKFLQDEEYLLTKNQIRFHKKAKVKGKPALKYDLSLLYQQKVNSNLLFFVPREWIYYTSTQLNDTSKFDRWKIRVLAEKPTIFSKALMEVTAKNIQTALQRKGYYRAKVESEFYYNGKKAYVTYHVNPNQQFSVDSLFYEAPDEGIQRLLENNKDDAYLSTGLPLSDEQYIKERDRIVKLLQNNGYAYFFPNYVSTLEADTTITAAKANLYLDITKPFKDSVHQTYRIGRVQVFPNYSPILDSRNLQDTIISGLEFIDTTFQFRVKPQTIVNAISLIPGNLYRLSDYEKTNRRLSALGIFKFVRIRQEIDTLQTNVINFRIELSMNKKLELGTDFELNYTSNNRVARTDNLFGISASPFIRNRNLMGGAESLVTNVSGGIEFNPGFSGNRFWNTAELGFQSALYIPKFIDYLGIWKGVDKIRLGKKVTPIDQRFYTQLRENALSRISASYNYVLVLDFYRYNLFNASFGFDLQQANTHRYIVNHIGLDYLLPIFEGPLQAIFESNPFFERSFGRQLFTSFFIRDFTYIYNSRVDNRGRSHYFSVNVESAGGEIFALNKLYNAIGNNSDRFQIGAIDFSQYFRLSLDYRRYLQITPKQSLAYRLYVGAAQPFGNSSDVPYVKQYAVGGPNSIRAWVQRGLGPGGYIDPLANEINSDGRYRLDGANRFALYQQGDLHLEFNAEYRFNLYWLLDGAFFLDAGNVWTIDEDSTRCGSQFLFSEKSVENCGTLTTADPFYKQIAVGAGFGFRFDFTYFILRLDLGVKLRYPFPFDTTIDPNTAREIHYWEHFRNWGFQDINFNLGFGYPF